MAIIRFFLIALLAAGSAGVAARSAEADSAVPGTGPASGLLVAQGDEDEAAVGNDVVQRLARLLDEERYDDAYRLAERERPGLEGDPVFDFYYGMAAIETDHLSEAVFALERVVMQRPGFARARLELARGQFMMGEDRRARRNFETVLAQDPPPPVEDSINRYLQAIRARAGRYSTVLTGHLEAGFGTDSNVNSATDDEEVAWVLSDIFGQDLQLGDESRELDDEFWRLAGGLRLSRPFATNVTGFGEVSFDERRNLDEDDFDIGRVNARIGTVLHGQRLQTELSVRGQDLRVGGDAYQDMIGATVNMRYKLAARTSLMGGLQWSELDYDELDNRDSTLALASAGISRVWRAGLRPVTSLNAFYGEESADENGQAAEAQAERDLHGVGLVLGLSPAPEWRLTTRYQYRNSEYGAENALFGETREDELHRIELDLYWQPTSSWRLGPHMRFADNDSNIELFDYDRSVFELRARYTYQ